MTSEPDMIPRFTGRRGFGYYAWRDDRDAA
jgi:hypothetical protein